MTSVKLQFCYCSIIYGFEDQFDHPKLSGEAIVQNAITEVAAMMGENVKLRRGFAMSMSKHGVMSTYLHTCPQPGLGRIAGILSLEVEDENASLDAVRRVGSELAMHVVAAKPLVVTKELVSPDVVQNEREILKSQAESSGRPQAAIEKMVEGRLRKYFEEVVLLEQKFIVNDTVNVQTLLSELSKEVGSPVKIGNFLRMEVGEGLQRACTRSFSSSSMIWLVSAGMSPSFPRISGAIAPAAPSMANRPLITSP
ncbi:hypothetical protein L1987_02237 [Smallanthus sonchifolius]|uniref:Uncharacterized protein n=1 Tax=Smallanthus sonchifolius TaxID=185202 RepID=A0ACB9K7G2_9ASTR|nr:hypothetical protein L1987_02237 [Smallanthus sonchifolius]